MNISFRLRFLGLRQDAIVTERLAIADEFSKISAACEHHVGDIIAPYYCTHTARPTSIGRMCSVSTCPIVRGKGI